MDIIFCNKGFIILAIIFLISLYDMLQRGSEITRLLRIVILRDQSLNNLINLFGNESTAEKSLNHITRIRFDYAWKPSGIAKDQAFIENRISFIFLLFGKSVCHLLL